jgi:hypothetical protein
VRALPACRWQDRLQGLEGPPATDIRDDSPTSAGTPSHLDDNGVKRRVKAAMTPSVNAKK